MVKVRRAIADELLPLIEVALSSDWNVDITRNGHLMMRSPDGAKQVLAPSKAGDWRSVRNLRSELRRAGLVIPPPGSPTPATAARRARVAEMELAVIETPTQQEEAVSEPAAALEPEPVDTPAPEPEPAPERHVVKEEFAGNTLVRRWWSDGTDDFKCRWCDEARPAPNAFGRHYRLHPEGLSATNESGGSLRKDGRPNAKQAPRRQPQPPLAVAESKAAAVALTGVAVAKTGPSPEDVAALFEILRPMVAPEMEALQAQVQRQAKALTVLQDALVEAAKILAGE